MVMVRGAKWTHIFVGQIWSTRLSLLHRPRSVLHLLAIVAASTHARRRSFFTRPWSVKLGVPTPFRVGTQQPLLQTAIRFLKVRVSRRLVGGTCNRSR